ncbi:MAG: copper resistance protein CopC [Vicinamibacterales bacterium]
MHRFRIVGLAVLAISIGLTEQALIAHGGLRRSNPAAGATLGATPKAVQLFFSERPEGSLSEIRVVDTSGQAYQTGRPENTPGDPLSLVVPIRPLARGVYIVNWRIVSAVDGHATAGAYAFGVLMVPTGVAVNAPTNAETSWLELLARWLFIGGLIVLLGAAAATAARFGGSTDPMLGACGWIVAVIGLALLVVAQTQSAGASLTDLLTTSIGRAFLGRVAAIAVAGGAMAIALMRAANRRGAMQVAMVASMVAMAVHVASGHAADGRGWRLATTIVAQWAHFAAAGVWLGGLGALLLGVRGAPSNSKAEAVRRFSRIAAAGLLVVAATGAIRSWNELLAWRDLVSTGYGRAVSIKIALTIAIVAAAALNRWSSVPRAAITLRPLRRVGSGELVLSLVALGAAAALGALPPPAAGFEAARELHVAGADFGTTVRVELTAASDQPGPNRFTVRARDYDSGKPVSARRVTLRFVPLDDPGVPATTLPLEPGPDASYVGEGVNLAFDGRWRVTALIERTSDSVDVPLELEILGSALMVSTVRIPGKPAQYTVEVPQIGHVRVVLEPERAGPSKAFVTCFDVLFEPRSIEDVVVTMAAERGPVVQAPVRRLDRNRFVADVRLQPAYNRIVIIARSADGTRTRTGVDLNIPH